MPSSTLTRDIATIDAAQFTADATLSYAFKLLKSDDLFDHGSEGTLPWLEQEPPKTREALTRMLADRSLRLRSGSGGRAALSGEKLEDFVIAIAEVLAKRALANSSAQEDVANMGNDAFALDTDETFARSIFGGGTVDVSPDPTPNETYQELLSLLNNFEAKLAELVTPEQKETKLLAALRTTLLSRIARETIADDETIRDVYDCAHKRLEGVREGTIVQVTARACRTFLGRATGVASTERRVRRALQARLGE